MTTFHAIRRYRTVLGIQSLLVLGASIGCVAQALARQAATADQSKAEVPSAVSLFDAHIAAIGGKDRLDQVRTRDAMWTISTGIKGLEISERVRQAAPRKLNIVSSNKDLGRSTTIANGDQAFESYGRGTPVRLQGGRLEAVLRQAQFWPATHWHDDYPSAKTLGVENVGDRTCYLVEAAAQDNHHVKMWFDRHSGHLVKMSVRSKETKGNRFSTTEYLYEDYREVEGIEFAHRIRRSFERQETVQTLDSIKLNVELDEDLFVVDDVTP